MIHRVCHQRFLHNFTKIFVTFYQDSYNHSHVALGTRMTKIFLVNIGANTSDRSRARSPIFKNDQFIYVPFSFKQRGNDGYKDYRVLTRQFVRAMHGRATHCDPDWDSYTYGDYCLNRRARAQFSSKKLTDRRSDREQSF
jgi:hypothetical protein